MISVEQNGATKKHSFSALERDSTALRRNIAAELAGKKEPIVLLAPNGYDFVRSLAAIWKTGCPAVPLCSTHPPHEWEYYIEDSGASLCLVHPSFEAPIREIVSKRGAKLLSTNLLSSETKAGISDTMEWKEDGDALFVYTSGTTGKPKGVVTTHSNVASSVAAMHESWQWRPEDHILHVLPLHHVHGLVNALITPLAIGATVELLPKFNAKAVWERFVQSYRQRTITPETSSHNMQQFNSQQLQGEGEKVDLGIITVFMAVPPIYVALIKEFDAMDETQQRMCKLALEPLRLMVSGSAALPEPILHRWETISGHRLLERYGMTEIGMALTNPYQGGERKPGWVGKPFPGVTARVHLDEDHSATTSKTEIGELYIKGPQVFKEYWRREAATKENFSEDGWFKTGDTAEYDPVTGYYRIMGRRSVDILKTGGYKVSALDIETEILSHPDVQEIAVVGLEDIEWGQIVGAIIALKPGVSSDAFTLQNLQKWAKERMASYKLPRRLLIVEQIPRNAMGKVNKKELVKLFNK